jgi:hypothetical protein
VLGLSTAGVQRVVVDASGNVGIGTASPLDRLHLAKSSGNIECWVTTGSGASGTTATLRLGNSDATYRNHSSYIQASQGAGIDQYSLSFGTASGGATPAVNRFSILTDGVKYFANGYISVSSSAIGPGAGTYPVKWNAASGVLTYDSSSRLVKDQIEDIPYGLASVLSLQPRKYFRTDDQKEEIGFIADEVQSIIPEVVPMVEKKVFTKDEQDTELIPGGVNYDKLTAVLVKAIQELEARLAALESK